MGNSKLIIDYDLIATTPRGSYSNDNGENDYDEKDDEDNDDDNDMIKIKNCI